MSSIQKSLKTGTNLRMNTVKFLKYILLCTLFYSCKQHTCIIFEGIDIKKNLKIVFSETSSLQKEFIISNKEDLKSLKKLHLKVVCYDDWREYATTPFGKIDIVENSILIHSFTIISEEDLTTKNTIFNFKKWYYTSRSADH